MPWYEDEIIRTKHPFTTAPGPLGHSLVQSYTAPKRGLSKQNPLDCGQVRYKFRAKKESTLGSSWYIYIFRIIILMLEWKLLFFWVTCRLDKLSLLDLISVGKQEWRLENAFMWSRVERIPSPLADQVSTIYLREALNSGNPSNCFYTESKHTVPFHAMIKTSESPQIHAMEWFKCLTELKIT